MHLLYVTEPIDVATYYNPEQHTFYSAVRTTPDRPREPRGRAAGDPASPHEVFRYTLQTGGLSRLSFDRVYFATSYEAVPLANALVGTPQASSLRVLAPMSAVRLLSHPALPRRLGYDPDSAEPFTPIITALDEIAPRDELRLAVVNMFHPAIGDAIVSSTMLRALRAVLSARFGRVGIDLYQSPYNGAAESIYRSVAEVNEVIPLPAPLAALSRYDGYVDFSAGRLLRDGLPWIDAFLTSVGVAPDVVPPDQKRNRVHIPAAVGAELGPTVEAARARGRPLLLFHPLASTAIRSVPTDRVAGVVHALLERSDCTIVCTVPVPVTHPRLVDWSAASRSFEHFAYLISQADLLLTVDTSAYHIADAFDVPGVVLFTTIDPAERVSYYPFVEGVLLRPDNALMGVHASLDPERVAYAAGLWDDLDFGAVQAALARVAARRAAARPTAAPPRRRRRSREVALRQ